MLGPPRCHRTMTGPPASTQDPVGVPGQGLWDGGRTVAEDSPAGLIAAEATWSNKEATLHDVFMKYTGRSLDEDVEEDADDESE